MSIISWGDVPVATGRVAATVQPLMPDRNRPESVGSASTPSSKWDIFDCHK